MRRLVAIFISIVFSLSVYSMEGSVLTAEGQVSEQERETFLEAINDIEIEEQLRESSAFQACQQRAEAAGAAANASREAKIQAFEQCMASEDGIAGIQDSDLETLAEGLNLSSFNKNAAKSATTIREYLTLRLRRSLYGMAPGEDIENIKNKDRNFVDHRTYYRLYAEQIGKNTLLQVSQYCLENIHFGDKKKVVISKKEQRTINGETVTALLVKDSSKSLTTSNSSANATALFEYTMPTADEVQEETSGGGSLAIDFLKSKRDSLEEVEVCTLTSQNRCRNLAFSKMNESSRPSSQDDATLEKEFMNINLVKKRKELEFAIASHLGGGDPAEMIGSNYEFCAVHVLKNMCDLYKCNTAYDDFGDDFKERCAQRWHIVRSNGQNNNNYRPQRSIGSTPAQANPDPNETKGQLACNVVQRLADYRKVLAATNTLIEDTREAGAAIGYSTDTVFKGEYGANGEDTVDELTSINSADLVDSVQSISGSEEEAQELLEECFNDPNNPAGGLAPGAENNEQCETLLATLDKEGFENISQKEISVAEIQKERLNELRSGADIDGLLEFLEKNNMTEYLMKNDDGTYSGRFAEMAQEQDLDRIIDAVRGEIEAREKATLAGIKQRFYNQTQINSEDQTGTNENFENLVAEEALGDINTHKQRVKELFEYSNLVSSYLTITDSEGEVVGQSSTGRQVELSNMDSNSALAQYFSGAEEDSGGSSGSQNSINYLQAIDAIVGIEKTEEEDAQSR